MKQQILSEISSKLSALGIPVQNRNDTDIIIETEFLDAGWSTGSKKINYEASIFANERDKVVYMYEKTREIGHGISFGSNVISSFQSGTTLFRKVKAVQYGLDGKAYEYTLDLGSIPRTVKETAKLYGWKFKIVINKNKAMYPPGYIPAYAPPQPQSPATPPATPIQPPYQQQPQPQYNNPQGAFYAQSKAPAPKGKAGTLGLIAFIILGVITAITFLLSSVSPAGLAIAAITLAVFGFWQRKIAYKGCFPSIVLWVVTVAILLLTLALTLPSGG